MIKRQLDLFESEQLNDQLEVLRETNPEYFKLITIKEDEAAQEEEAKKEEPVTNWTNEQLKLIEDYEGLCVHQAAMFYNSTKFNGYSKRILLEFDDYYQEAKYKLCWLVKEEVHPNKFEKAVENHLKDYRSTHKKLIKKEEEKEDDA